MDPAMAKMRAEEAGAVYEGKETPLDAELARREENASDENFDQTNEREELRNDARQDQQPSGDTEEPLDGDDEHDPLNEIQQTLSTITSKLGSLDEFSSRVKQLEKRVGSVTNAVFNSEKQKKEEQQTKAAAELEQELKEFSEEFPTLDNAIVKRLELMNRTAKSGKDFEEIQNTLTELRTAMETKAVTKDELELTVLSAVYPDWQKDVATPEFLSWRDKVADKTLKERAMYGTSAADGVAVLKAFKEYQGTQTPSRSQRQRQQQKLERSLQPRRRQAAPLKAEQDMTDAEYRAHVKKQVFGS